MNAVGLVTAAGKSTRMGGFPKPLLRFGNDRFVERIVRTYARAGVKNKLVVIGHEANVVRERIDLHETTVIDNEDYESGMLSSVQIGVRHAQTLDVEAMYLWPVDFPCVQPSAVERLWEKFNDSDADIVVPTHNGERGHPALFSRSTFESLLNAPETEGARAVVYDERTQTVEAEIGDNRILVDIDTPAEYWDAVKQYGYNCNPAQQCENEDG